VGSKDETRIKHEKSFYRREFGTFSVIVLAFIPGARKDPQVRDRCFKSREKVCESYHKQRQKLCMHLLAHSCLLGRSFLRERGCCRLLRIYARWKAFLFFGKGLLGLEKVRLTNPRVSFHVCVERMHRHCPASLSRERSFFAHR